MRATTAYFVGAGTIVVALAIGLGGGIVAGNIMNPVAPKQTADSGKPARRAEAPTTTTGANASSERVHYLTGTQAFGTPVAPAAPAQDDATPQAKPDTPAVQAAVEPAPPAPPPAVVRPAEQTAAAPASPDNANARAKDSDIKRDTDVRRSSAERRRAERRERWAERRRQEPRIARESTDWDDVARNVRADTEGRDLARRPRNGEPQIILFGSDDD
jgi:hypothetical protein